MSKVKKQGTMKTKMFFVLGLFVLLLVAYSVSYAAIFEIRDVFAGTAAGTVEQLRTGTGLVDTFSSGGTSFVTTMAFDGGGNLFATNYSERNVMKLAEPTAPHTDSTGAQLLSRNTGSRADRIDLGADNSKLYFTEYVHKGVFSLDRATGTMSIFNANFGNYALRLLADDSMLVADESDIVLLDNRGKRVRTYGVAGNDNRFALDLDPDGKTFWSSDFETGLIQQFDIGTGSLEPLAESEGLLPRSAL
jgi:outer membrane protein assembly factor BamB